MLFQNEPVVEHITAALFVPAGSGAPVHTNRYAHGLAYNVQHTTVYRFSEGTVLTCNPGQCIYLPRGSSYTVDKTEPTEIASAGVHAINFLLKEPLADSPFVVSLRSQAALAAYIHGEEVWRQKGAGYREVCISCLYTLLGLLQQEGYTHISQTEKLLTPALSYIDKNFTKLELPIPMLASLCRVSEQYLRRIFRNVYGVSPSVYIRNRRLSFARELLQTGEYTVSQASAAAGFNDLAYFSREFKKVYGTTPSSYSKKC